MLKRNIKYNPLHLKKIQGKKTQIKENLKKTLKEKKLLIKKNSKKKILHLGNVGEDAAYRSKKLAQMAKSLDFYGIDLKSINNKQIHHPSAEKDITLKPLREARLRFPQPKNLTQFRTDFVTGLNLFPNNFLDIISSDYAVGYYDQKVTTRNLRQKAKRAYAVGSVNTYSDSLKYTQEIVDVIYEKLKPNGKFISYYFSEKKINSFKYFEDNLKTSLNNSKFINIKEEKVNLSKMPEKFRSFYSFHLRIHNIFRITAIK